MALALIGAVFFLLALWFPATGDDWKRIAFEDRTPSGFFHQAVEGYRDHNGRVLGNNLSYLLIEPVAVRALAKSLTVVALVALLLHVTRTSRGLATALALGAVVLVPPSVLRESYGWSAGFFNYVPPLVGLLLLVSSVRRAVDSSFPERRERVAVAARKAMAALAGLLSCLFIEHVTVAVIGVAAGSVLLLLLARRRLAGELVAWLVGSLLGAAIMFGSPGLRGVYDHNNAYFSYPSTVAGYVLRASANYAVITQTFLFGNLFLMAWFTVLGLGMGLRRGSRDGRRDLAMIVLTLVLWVYALVTHTYGASTLVCSERPGGTCATGRLGLDVLMMSVALGLLVLMGHRSLGAASDRAAWYALLAATLLMLAPLLVVAPVGPRNVIDPTITLGAMLLLLTRELVQGRSRAVRLIRSAVVTVVATAVVIIGVHSWQNAQVQARRIQLLEEAVASGRSHVVMPAFPHPQWVYSTTDVKIGNRYFLRRPRDIRIDWPQQG